jgi:hypothetical protein
MLKRLVLPLAVVLLALPGGLALGQVELTPPEVLSTALGDSEYPRLAVSGSSIYLVYRGDPFAAGSARTRVLFRRSTDGGQVWRETVDLSEALERVVCDSPQCHLDSGVDSPALAAFASNVYVVWSGRVNGNGGSPYEVFLMYSTDGGTTFQAYNANGNISGTAGDSRCPAVAAVGSEVHVVWKDNANGSYQIWYARSNDGGATFEDPVPIVDLIKPRPSQAQAHCPAIAAVQGRVVVAWPEESERGTIIRHVYSIDSGQSFISPGSRGGLSRKGYGQIEALRLAADGSQFVAVWSERLASRGQEGAWRVLIASSSDGGRSFRVGKAISLSTGRGRSPTDWQTKFPDVAVWNGGVWITVASDLEGNFEVYLLRSDNGGRSFQNLGKISDNPSASLYPALAVRNARVHLVWADDAVPPLPTRFRIYYRQSLSSEAKIASITGLSGDLGLSISPQLALSGSNVYLVWKSDLTGSGVTGERIMFRRSVNLGITWEPDLMVSEGDPQAAEVRDPTVAADGTRVYLAWAQRVCENASCSFDLFLASDAAGGAFPDPGSARVNLSEALDGMPERCGSARAGRQPLVYQRSSDEIMPVLAADSRFVYLVWASDSVGTFDIWFARWNSGAVEEGDLSEPDLLCNLSISYKQARAGSMATRGDALHPTLAIDGSFVYVAWADNHPKPNTFFTIYALSSSDRGNDFSGLRPQKVSEGGAAARGRTAKQTIGDALYPALAAQGNRAFLAWSEYRNGHFEILLSATSGGRTGGRFASPTVVSSALKPLMGRAPGDSLFPAVVAGRADLYLCWADNTSGNFEIWALLNPSAPNPGARLLNLSQSWGDSEFPSLALDGNERLYAVWVDKSSGKEEIYFRGALGLTKQLAGAQLVEGGLVNEELAPIRSLGSGSFALEIEGATIASLVVDIFDLQGRRVAHHTAAGRRLEFLAVDDHGTPLANGVYLYLITARLADGTTVRSEVRKLAIVR